MRAAGAFTDLVFHALSFVPPSAAASAASRAASHSFPSYVAFAKASLPEAAWGPCAEDALVLATLFEPVEVAHAIPLFAELHGSIRELLATGRSALVDLGPDDVASSGALKALCSLPQEPLEILRADLLLCGAAFEAAHRAVLAPHADQLVQAASALAVSLPPRLAKALERVEISATLGARGRGFLSRIVVGASCLPGGPITVKEAIVLAIHETAVEHAGQVLRATGIDPTWNLVEPVALEAERLLDLPAALDHRRWLDSLDRSGLAPLDRDLRAAAEAVVAALDDGRSE